MLNTFCKCKLEYHQLFEYDFISFISTCSAYYIHIFDIIYAYIIYLGLSKN